MKRDNKKSIIRDVLGYLSFKQGTYVTIDEIQAQIQLAYIKHISFTQWMNTQTMLHFYLQELKQWKFISEQCSGQKYLYKIELPGIYYLEKFSDLKSRGTSNNKFFLSGKISCCP